MLLSMQFSHAICPRGMRVIDYSTHIFVKGKCALLISVQNSHSVIKSLLNMIRFGKYFILTSSKYQVSQCVLTITPRILLLFCSTDQTTCCYLLRGWRVAPLLLHTPSTFHTSQHLNHLFGHCQEQKEKNFPCSPLTQTHADNDVCRRMWLNTTTASPPVTVCWLVSRTQLLRGPLLILCPRCSECRHFEP